MGVEEWLAAHWQMSIVLIGLGRIWWVSETTRKKVEKMNGDVRKVAMETATCQARQSLCPWVTPGHPVNRKK
jgi:hypothetical protein